MVPPLGCTKRVPFRYEHIEFSCSIGLSRDNYRCIFSHLQGWDLLPLRLVSKQWNDIISNYHVLWEIRIKQQPDCWNHLRGMRLYIQHMFCNVPAERSIVSFFFRYPKFFLYICELILGKKALENSVVNTNVINVANGTYCLYR